MLTSGYRNLFELAPFKPDLDILDKLGLSMTGNRTGFFPSGINPLELVKNDETDSTIPAGYVYLGQFIDHDITLDSKSHRFEPTHFPWKQLQPEEIAKIVNLRRPFFDLETIYGFSKPSPSAKVVRKVLLQNGSNTLLNLGDTFPEPMGNSTATNSFVSDLPRFANSSEAAIIESRNDENLVIAQLQVAFIKFHNAIVRELGDSNTCQVFRQARKIAIRHYQQIILKDFLPRIVKPSVLQKVIKQVATTGQATFYQPSSDDLFIPLEFSVGAYRMGHSMIRDLYNWNIMRKAALMDLFRFTGREGSSTAIDELSKFKLRSIWVINWNWFFDLSDSGERDENLNFAKRIDTKLSSSLDRLFPSPPHDDTGGRINSLGTLDLYRGRALRLPTGQSLANEMAKQENIRVLSEDEIEGTFNELLTEDARDSFKKETPLFYYLLAEAEIQNKLGKTDTLGDVGSWLVAEVFIKLLYESPFSILKRDLESDDYFIGKEFGGKFGMPEMLKWMASRTKEGFDELNPVQKIS